MNGLEKLAARLEQRLASAVPLVYGFGVRPESVSVDEGVVSVLLTYGLGEVIVFQLTLDAARELARQLAELDGGGS